MVQSKKVCKEKKRGRRFGRERRVFAFRLSLVLEWGVCLALVVVETGRRIRLCISMCKQASCLKKSKKEKRTVREGGSTFGP